MPMPPEPVLDLTQPVANRPPGCLFPLNPFDDPVHHVIDVLHIQQRLHDIINRSEPKRFLQKIKLMMAGQHHGFHPGEPLPDMPEQLEAVHARHRDIREQQIHFARLQKFHRGFAVCGFADNHDPNDAQSITEMNPLRTSFSSSTTIALIIEVLPRFSRNDNGYRRPDIGYARDIYCHLLPVKRSQQPIHIGEPDAEPALCRDIVFLQQLMRGLRIDALPLSATCREIASERQCANRNIDPTVASLVP